MKIEIVVDPARPAPQSLASRVAPPAAAPPTTRVTRFVLPDTHRYNIQCRSEPHHVGVAELGVVVEGSRVNAPKSRWPT